MTYLQSLGEAVEVTWSDRTTEPSTDWRGWRGPGLVGLLGGPLGVLRPRDLSRRLPSGWGFVLAVVLAGGGLS